MAKKQGKKVIIIGNIGHALSYSILYMINREPALKWWNYLRSTRLMNGTKDKGYYSDHYFGFGQRVYQYLTEDEIIQIYLTYNKTRLI